MRPLSAATPLGRALRQMVGEKSSSGLPGAGIQVEPLPAGRQVLRFAWPEGRAVVGKFFSAYPPLRAADLSLVREYDNYQQLPALGLDGGRRLTPRLLGRWTQGALGLLLEAVPGPDLDGLIHQACRYGNAAALDRGLEKLARLLACFHSRPAPKQGVAVEPALAYLDKVMGQLQGAGLLTREDCQALTFERAWWQAAFRDFSEGQVLVHGDATPTNFLFPNGRAVALDLERLRFGDRLWDLSWVAGELKNAWGWRTGNWSGAEAAIGHFFRAYLAATGLAAGLRERLYRLNPFYMALAELRIARNSYHTMDYRRELVAEARRCLAGGRRW
jgi:aminoglycoside phosphotransferase